MTDIRALREACSTGHPLAACEAATNGEVIALLDRLKEAEEALASIKGETQHCAQDLGADRFGPIGCALGDQCVCAAVRKLIPRPSRKAQQ